MPSKVPTTNPVGAFPEDSFKYSPLEHARTLFVGFTQGLFAAAPEGAYHWDPDSNATEIYISNENPVQSANIGQRPAISFTRGPVQFYSLGLDDMLDYDARTGTKKKSVLVPGTMVINCSSRVPLECERIAWICAEMLWLHREMLMRAGFFEIGRQPALGSPSPAGSIIVADAGEEWYTTPVTCPFQFYRTSQTSPLGKNILEEITMSIRLRLQAVNEQSLRIGGHCGPIEGPGANVPVGVQGYRPPAFAPQASDVYGGTPVAGNVAPVLLTAPHPLNPAQRVVVRASRPNCPAVRPAGMGGRSIPIQAPVVEESCSSQKDAHVTETSTVKV
jgi:hypothetical protein